MFDGMQEYLDMEFMLFITYQKSAKSRQENNGKKKQSIMKRYLEIN